MVSPSIPFPAPAPSGALTATTIVSSLLTVRREAPASRSHRRNHEIRHNDAGAPERAPVTLFIRHNLGVADDPGETPIPRCWTILMTVLWPAPRPRGAGWSHDTEGPDDMACACQDHADGGLAAYPGAARQTRAGSLAGGLPGSRHRMRPHRREVVLQFAGRELASSGPDALAVSN